MATKEATEVLEEAKEVVSDTVDILEDKISWIKTPKGAATLAGALGVLAGAGIGYLVASRILRSKYQALADEQVESVKATYAVRRKDPEIVDLAQMAEDAREDLEAEQREAAAIAEANGYVPYDRVVPNNPADIVVTPTADNIEAAIRDRQIPAVETTNVFEAAEPNQEFDYEIEMAWREANPDRPYIISKDEFDEGSEGYDQSDLTYYEGDDTLSDNRDTVVPDIDALIGRYNLSRFGAGSGDAKVMFIRNTKLEMDFEIIRSDDAFMEVVYGSANSLKHSESSAPRRFRADRE